MADDLYSELAQHVIVFVGESLRRSDHDTLAGMDAERVEVFHIADCDAVVEAVTHNFIFHFLPPFKTFLNEHLRRERESLLHKRDEFIAVVAEAAAKTSQGVRGAYDYRIAESVGSRESVFY